MDLNALQNENVNAAPATEAPAQASDIVGSKSEVVQLVAPIGNPLKPDVTPIMTKDADGKSVKSGRNLTKPTIVGYMFKATEDIEVPDFGIPTNLKSNRMGYENLNGSKLIKAGETFPLTLMEMAALASREEFNRHFGGEHPAICVYLTKPGKNAGKREVEFYPAQLQLETGSIKNLEYVDICEVKETPGTMVIGKNGETKPITHREALNGIKPGFEKFQSLTEKSPAGGARGPRTTAPKEKVWDDNAKAFSALLKQKQSQQ